MQYDREPEKITIKDWFFRVRKPKDPAHPDLLLLLHGHLGNENVMWILTNPVPNTYWMLAPRAPVETAPGKYSWHEIGPEWASWETYQNLTKKLLERVDFWAKKNALDFKRINVIGFSQGAVMGYALALQYPQRVGKIAALAGFIPQGWKNKLDESDLNQIQFFIAHGINDDIVPIKKAKQAAEWLKEKNARVTFCEADIGHKLSANCFNGLGEFFD